MTIICIKFKSKFIGTAESRRTAERDLTAAGGVEERERVYD